MAGLGKPNIKVLHPNVKDDDVTEICTGPSYAVDLKTFSVALLRYNRITGVLSGYAVVVLDFRGNATEKARTFPTNRRAEAWTAFAEEVVKITSHLVANDIETGLREAS